MSKTKTSTDTQLVLDFKEGDLNALPHLVERWHKRFCDKAYWITKDAEVSKDIAQETWKVVMAKIGQLQDANKFGIWSLRIVCSKSFDWLRKKQRHQSQLKDYQKDQTTIGIEAVDDYEIKRNELKKAITSLSLDQQHVIHLFYLEEYSLKEMSKILQVSTGTVKSRLFHAREKLKALINIKKDH
ncbi:RNA polymerase sigma-70 factor (ECF subfamily) [Flavobacteriaceae bacterium MAR_2010_105]|nr:RNA polymerase sigma-70 factor (ECF subfamily) [Flavobacteriaceae bacterium MAR_2010_105]